MSNRTSEELEQAILKAAADELAQIKMDEGNHFKRMLEEALAQELEQIKTVPESPQLIQAKESIRSPEQLRLEELAEVDRELGENAIIIICDDEPLVLEFDQMVIDDRFGAKTEIYENPELAMSAYHRAIATGKPCILMMDHHYGEKFDTGAHYLRRAMAIERAGEARFTLQNGDNMVHLEGAMRLFKPSTRVDVIAVVRAQLSDMQKKIVVPGSITDELNKANERRAQKETEFSEVLGEAPLVGLYEMARRSGSISSLHSERESYWRESVSFRRDAQTGDLLPLTETDVKNAIQARKTETQSYKRLSNERGEEINAKLALNRSADPHIEDDRYWQVAATRDSGSKERQ